MTDLKKKAWVSLSAVILTAAAIAGIAMMTASPSGKSTAESSASSSSNAMTKQQVRQNPVQTTMPIAQKTEAPGAEPRSASMNIQEVTSPGGIKAWLVESHNVPLISMRFAFTGGSSQDPTEKPGVSYFLSGMLDEGAGDLTSMQFQERLEELAVRMNFETSRDHFLGSFQTLTKNKDEAFALLKLALSEPRFDADAMERIRSQILTGMKFDAQDPEKVAGKEWFKVAFKGHPYAIPTKGTEAALKTITADDLRSYKNRVLAQDNLTISVVGDIDAATLGPLLDKIFGALPQKSDLVDIEDAPPPFGPVEKHVAMKVPQSVIQFGHAGIARKDKDFIAAYILNYIIGGGGFSSRLMEEVREKRGLAYSVYSYLSPYRHGSVYLGGVATKNAAVKEVINVIRSVLTRIAQEGPTAKELAYAKQYLTGSYALRFDTSAKIASQLLWIQIEDLGRDYITNRNKMIEAVLLDDIKRVAKRILKPDQLIITIVGNPKEPPA